jgi:lipoprotein-releasing system permease protein
VGVLAGTAGGVALALNVEALVQQLEQLLGMQFISGQVYAISELPSRLRWQDVAWIAGAALAMSFLATVHPARNAARTDPVEALRHE